MRVETEMATKCNKHFGNLRDWWANRGPFDTMRLLQSQAFGTKKCLEALKAGGRDIPLETIDMFVAQEEKFEKEATKLNPGEIPEDDLALSPHRLDSQFVDMRAFVGLDPHGTNTHLVSPRIAAALRSPANHLKIPVAPSRSTGNGTPERNAPVPDVQATNKGVASTRDEDQTTVLEISDSSAADREDAQDEESDKDEDVGEIDKDIIEEMDYSQVNPPENPNETHERETIPRTENEGDQSVNAGPPRPSVGEEDVAREQVEDVGE